MDHPNIAKVLNAGATPTGRPFFVMDLVKGISLIRQGGRIKRPANAGGSRDPNPR
jgi:hypothetical protein